MNLERSRMITKALKSLMCVTIARQDRNGQRADQENLQVADANKNVFRLTANDAQELESEFTTSQRRPDPETAK